MCGEKRLRSVIHYFLYKVINLYMYAIFRYDLVLKVAIILVSLFLLLQFGRRLFANSGIRERVNPQAVKGYGYCEVNQSKLTNYTVSYQCDFKPKPSAKDVLIVTFVNSAWISLAQNWIYSAEKVGLKENLYLVAFEKGVCSQLPDVTCYEHPTAQLKGAIFAAPDYQKLVIERTRVILKLLSCWPRIALVDADVTFLKNPLEYLEKIAEDKDIVFQADSSRVRFIDTVLPYVFNYICGGFIYMKSNYATKQLWLAVLQYQENFLWNDQAGLNICIRHHTQTVRWDTLDSEYFPNGQQYFTYKQRSGKNMIVHANHLEGDDKIIRMIASDVWCYLHGAVQMCSGDVYRTRCTCQGLEPSAHAELPEWCDDFVRVCRDKYGISTVLY